jgi:hypothetical protein
MVRKSRKHSIYPHMVVRTSWTIRPAITRDIKYVTIDLRESDQVYVRLLETADRTARYSGFVGSLPSNVAK